ncbi:hypothetical protein Ocin01_16902 [Orchesella cincta]|uniref:BTB domain-containing protein n=1 Tax=Orchesella cincta TaxID=48709 RepID=A0A1D2M9X5_ORCCI|nr:hypothetical protein Ocin01_16902 [Orchesella cincta]
MIVSLVNVNDVEVSNYGPLTSKGFEMNLTVNDIVPKPFPQGTQREEEYCKNLYDILRGKKINDWNLSIYFEWDPSRTMGRLRLQGKLLDTLQEVCGENIKLRVNGEIRYKRVIDNSQILPPAFHASSPTMTFSLLYDASSPKQVSFCRHSALAMTTSFREYQRIFVDQMNTITIKVSLLVDDEYLHEGGSDLENLRGTCKRIQLNNVRSDVSILPANSADVLLANKCFLAAHSPVLDALFEGSFKEAKTNVIKWVFCGMRKSVTGLCLHSGFPTSTQSSI